MKLIPLKATKETVDIKKAGLITYETDQSYDSPAIILMNNPSGDYGVILVDQIHTGGKVVVRMRPAGPSPVKKYNLGDIVAQLAVF
jgi:hypothetical protein